MNTKFTKNAQIEKRYTKSNVTNPLRIEIGGKSYNRPIFNTRQILDKATFVILSAGAVWAFYAALSSLML